MITFEKAYQIVMLHLADFGKEEIPLLASVNRILAEKWVADRDFPPFHRVMMDGIAIKYNDQIKANCTFVIEGIVAAGSPKLSLKNDQNCLEIMTGAILPNDTNAVIRYEDVTIREGIATLHADINPLQNIHQQGQDRRKGDILIQDGKRISTADIGVGASIGKSKVKVSKLPQTTIISTGDELVKINESPLPHQIRKSNVYQISSALEENNIEAKHLHLNDNRKEIKDFLQSEILSQDLIILSGGVSKGKFDFIPIVLEELGVKKFFHRVSQRPGKPFWFGAHPSGCTIFALPGNPISSFMCTQVYLKSWLDRSLGLTNFVQKYAELEEDILFKPDLTYFMEVKLAYDKSGKIKAIPQKGNGSGDLANLSRAHAFLKLPQGQNIFNKGEAYPFYQYAAL
ncbi:MAG: molybdopterin molybdotransferase MoeA [Saprospiraceae bacterium]